MASVGSSSSGRYGGSRGDGNSSAPIPFRQGDLDYSPPMLCHRGKRSARWISWSDENPCRRYHICLRRRTGGCDFWYWIDPLPSAFQRDVLKQLRDTVQVLKTQNREKQDELRHVLRLLEQNRETNAVITSKQNEEPEDDVKDRVLRLEKELGWSKFWLKCVVVVVLVVVLQKFF
ncbi:hypothetical protein U9M48_002457 [Paspalum notatum var. saurae]|uniref:Zinc finger GRF-type domain-containing protein n=1 Tax=Paspalum notatum var. saurae TaxID=547442 RepID=A0AAQ3SHG8_PASNO